MLLQYCPIFANSVVEMAGKAMVSRLSDECLMVQETVIPLYIVYQAVMRKFTSDGKAQWK